VDIQVAWAGDDTLGVRAFRFAVAARSFTEMPALVTALLDELALFDLTAAACGFVSGPKAATGDLFHFVHWKPEWVEYYRTQQFLLADPVPRWARSSGMPVTWSELRDLMSPRDRGRKVIEAGARFGYREGMLVPVRSGNNALAAVSFGGDRGPFTIADQVCLTLIAHAAFEAAERIGNAHWRGRPTPILSAREIECLALMARGHSDMAIGKLIGISGATVRFHLSNVRDKLGVSSRVHLAAAAVAQGFVTI
jgi:LuxR family quorum-sensing system transcriptional regulator CciR